MTTLCQLSLDPAFLAYRGISGAKSNWWYALTVTYYCYIVHRKPIFWWHKELRTVFHQSLPSPPAASGVTLLSPFKDDQGTWWQSIQEKLCKKWPFSLSYDSVSLTTTNSDEMADFKQTKMLFHVKSIYICKLLSFHGILCQQYKWFQKVIRHILGEQVDHWLVKLISPYATFCPRIPFSCLLLQAGEHKRGTL